MEKVLRRLIVKTSKTLAMTRIAGSRKLVVVVVPGWEVIPAPAPAAAPYVDRFKTTLPLVANFVVTRRAGLILDQRPTRRVWPVAGRRHNAAAMIFTIIKLPATPTFYLLVNARIRKLAAGVKVVIVDRVNVWDQGEMLTAVPRRQHRPRWLLRQDGRARP